MKRQMECNYKHINPTDNQINGNQYQKTGPIYSDKFGEKLLFS